MEYVFEYLNLVLIIWHFSYNSFLIFCNFGENLMKIAKHYAKQVCIIKLNVFFSFIINIINIILNKYFTSIQINYGKIL